MKKQYLKRTLPLLLCFMLALSLIACSPSPSDATPQPQNGASTNGNTTPAADLPPAANGASQDLVIAFDQEPTHLDAASGAPYAILWASDPMHDYLFTMDDSGENIITSLVDTYEFLGDTQMRFTLNDATFHDGRPVTVADVTYTLTDYIMRDEVGSHWSLYLSCIDSIEAISDKEGVIHFNTPHAAILDHLTWIPIYPEGTLPEQQRNSPIGCGPFKFVEWAANQYVKYEKYDGYWKADDIALDTIAIRFYSDYNAAKTAFLADEAHILYWVEGADMPSFDNSDKYQLFSAAYGSYFVHQNVESCEYFMDANVRKAVMYAIDKDFCVETCIGGNGEPSVIALSKASVFYDKNWEYEYDLNLAKEYMAASAYPDGFEITLITPNTPTEGALGEAVAHCLSQIGIAATVNKLEWTAFSESWTGKTYELAICGHVTPNDPDYPMAAHIAYESNYTGYNNPQIEDLLTQASTTFDTNKRKALYSEAFGKYIEDAATVFVLNENRTAALKETVSGMVMWPARYKWNKIVLAD